MARIFLSHSSKDNAQVVALAEWLVRNGWGRDDLFLDIDPQAGIAPGERWQRKLNEAANRCEAVLFLISRDWLASRWCLEELALAHKLNKRLFGILIDTVKLDDVPPRLKDEWQVIDLESGRDGKRFEVELPNGQQGFATFSTGGLERLRSGLVRAGLDPRFFAWPPPGDPNRSPYRGLSAMEAEDAGIFYGREAATIAALDQMRGLAETPAPRLMAVLGASGAGKSSFMRAGLVPRLKRDDRHFRVLPTLRPERAAISGKAGLVASLDAAAQELGLKWTRAWISDAISKGEDAIAEIMAELVDKAGGGAREGRTTPAIVLPIDQAEELFMAEGKLEAEQFLALVAALLRRPESNLIALLTIRTDSYEKLQLTPALTDVRQLPFNLPALARGSYQRVIEGPAERLAGTDRALRIEPALTTALLADIEDGGGKDALPLLAFAMARLYEDHGGDGDLTFAEYLTSGRITGAIEAAVERALAASNADPGVPVDRTAKLALLRRAMIPWLAGIDPDTRTPRRKVARFSDIPDEARPLIGHFVEQRLLATDVSTITGERTIEPAHEALLRQWGLIDDWLKEDIAVLASLEAVQRAARDWSANLRDANWLAHVGGRLDDAEAIKARVDIARGLDANDIAYLDACRKAETARRDHELEEARKLAEEQRKNAEALALVASQQRMVASRTRLGLLVAVILAVVAAIGGLYGLRQADNANVALQRAEAESQKAEVERKNAEQKKAEAEQAQQQATATLQESRTSTSRYLADLARERIGESRLDDAIALARAAMPFEFPDWPMVRTAENALRLAIQRYVTATVAPFASLAGHSGTVRGAIFSPDGDRLLTWSYDGTARLWDVNSSRQLELFQHDGGVKGAQFNSKGDAILTWSLDGTVRYWPKALGSESVVFRHDDVVIGANFSADEGRVLSWSHDGTARIWDVARGRELASLKHGDVVLEARYFENGNKILTFSFDGSARTWKAVDGGPLQSFGHMGEAGTVGIRGATLFAAESRLLTWSYDKSARIWNVENGQELHHLNHEHSVDGALLFSNEKHLLTWADKSAVIWNTGNGTRVRDFSHDATILGATVSKDEQHLLTWAGDNTLQLWNLGDGRRLAWSNHADLIIGARFSPDGKAVLSWSHDGTARLWSDITAERPRVTMLQHDGVVRNAVFDDRGNWIWTRSDDGTARLWDMPGANLVATLRHQGEIFAIVGSSRNALATVSSDGTARVWDLARPARYAELSHDEKVNGAGFSMYGSRLLSWSADNTARIWDMTNGQAAVVLQHDDDVLGAGFADGERAVYTWSLDRTIRIWDGRSGQEAVRIDVSQRPEGVLYSHPANRLLAWFEAQPAILWDAHSGSLIAELAKTTGPTGAAFATDAGRALLWSDGTIRIIDLGGGHEVRVLEHNQVAGAAFSDDGARVLSWSDDGTLRVWDLATTAKPVEMVQGTSVLSAKFAGNRILSVADNDYQAKIWDAASGEVLFSLPHGEVPIGGAFGQDGTAWTWSSISLHAWDVQTGKERLRLGAGEGTSRSALVADGKMILTSAYSEDRLWDIETGDLIAVVPGRSNDAVSPDGHRLATWSMDGSTIQVWPLLHSPDELSDISAQVVRRLSPLSPVERCQAYLERLDCDILAKSTERHIALAGDIRPLTGPLFKEIGAGEGTYRAESEIQIELLVNDRAEMTILHDKPFQGILKRVELDRVMGNLTFRFDNRITRSFGISVAPALRKHAERGDRVLVVHMDEATGDPLGGGYFPLLVY